MKLKSLLVITLFVVACSFASAQTFGFASVDSGLYCDYEQLQNAGDGYWGGFDNYSACGSSTSPTISGFSASLSNDGEPGHGAGVIYGDSVYALEEDFPEGQWTVWTALKANKQNKEGFYSGKYSWVGAAAFSGVFAGINYGYLSTSIPSKTGDSAMRGPSTGKIAANRRK